MTLGELYLSDLGDAWAAAIFRASWQGALVIGLVWCVCRLVPRLPAWARCWLWRLALVKLLLLAFWPGSIDLRWLSPSTEVSPIAWERASANSGEALPEEQPPANHAKNGAVVAAAPAHTQGHSTVSVRSVASLLWAAGVLAILILLVTRVRAVGRWRRDCTLVKDPGILALCEALSAEIGLTQPPLIMFGVGCESPVVFGALRTCVVLPANLAEQADSARLRLILRHELAHIRRGDLIWNWLATAAWAIFFFHPLVWLALRELRLNQELACDAHAVASRESSIAEYGALLVELVDHHRSPANLLATIGVVESFEFLKRRLKAMKDAHLSPRWARPLATCVLAAAVAGLLPWRLVAQVSDDRNAGENAPDRSSARQFMVAIDQIRPAEGKGISIVPSGLPMESRSTGRHEESGGGGGSGWSTSGSTAGSSGGSGGSFKRPNFVIDARVKGPVKQANQLIVVLDSDKFVATDDLGRDIETPKTSGPFKIELPGMKYPKGSGCVPIHVYVGDDANRIRSVRGELLVAEAHIRSMSFEFREGATYRSEEVSAGLGGLEMTPDGIKMRVSITAPTGQKTSTPLENMPASMSAQQRVQVTIEDDSGVVYTPRASSAASGSGNFGGSSAGTRSSSFSSSGSGGSGGGRSGGSGGSGGGGFSGGSGSSGFSGGSGSSGTGGGGFGGSGSSGSGGGGSGSVGGHASRGNVVSSEARRGKGPVASGTTEHELQFSPLPQGVTIKKVTCTITDVVGKIQHVPFEFENVPLP